MDHRRTRSSQREKVLRYVASEILKVAVNDGIAMVAIDGVDGAGKTTFADELAAVLRADGKPVIRATVDGFHNPRADRYRLGRSSPEGFYRDSYDYPALRAALLDPLRAGARYRRANFDVDTDAPVHAPEEDAAPGSILLFDGIFLHRAELRDYWDLSILLDVPWERNHHLPLKPSWNVGLPDPSSADHRYAEGQRIYFRECHPAKVASIVIDNADLAAPVITKRA